MATKWTSPTWRMPEESNQSKFENYSLSFDGSEFIDLGDNFDNVFTSDNWSVSAWIYATANTSYDNFFNKGTTVQFYLFSNKIQIYLAPSGIGVWPLESTATLSLNTWYNIVFTRSGNENKLYINGTLDNSATSTGSISSSTGSLTIGAFNEGSSYFWEGELNDYSIFDYALSQAQVNYLYNSGIPQNPMAISGNAPIAYYPLGGSSTGSSSSLTIPNDSVPSATVFNFNGSSDEIVVSNDAALQIDGDITISAWIYAESDTGRIVSKRGGGGTNYDFYIESRYLRLYDGGTGPFSTGRITLNQWTHILISVTSGTGTYYIDNVPAGTGTFSISSVGTSQPLFIGGAYTPVLANFDGKMSNVQTWAAGLSDSEVATLYNNGQPLMTGTQPQAANLKAWYKMGIDTSNWDGSNWQLSNSAANYSTALDFEGSDRINVNSVSSVFSDASNFTISGWFNWANYSNANEWLFMASGSNINTKRVQIEAYNKQLYFSFIGATGVVRVSMTTAQWDAKWVHMVAVFDASAASADKMIIYLNGARAANVAYTEPTGNSPTDIVNVSFGNRTDGLYNFEGLISNFAVYNTSLSSANALSLYNSGTPQNTILGSPQGWWKLDSTTITDSSGNGNTGTNVGATQVSSLVSTLNGTSSGMTTANLVNSDLTRSIPYSSYSMYMTGSTDDTYFDLGTDIDIGTGGNTTYSWSIWVKPIYDSISDVVIFGDSGANDDGSLVLSYSGGNWSAKLEQNGTDLKSSTGAIVNDTWAHIVVVVDSTASTKKMYINGQEDTASGGTGAGPNGTIKNINSSNTSNQYTGSVSNWAFWNSSLSADSILSIYNGGTPNDLTNLNPTHWWSMSSDSYFNGSSWTCPDLIGSNNLTGVNDSGQELLGNGPGSTGSGTATGMNIPANLQGNAPNSTKNAFSINMTADDKTSSVPDISS